jgi:biotin carboxylase
MYGHNHLSDPGAVKAKIVQNRVLQKAADNPKAKTAALVDEFADKCQDPGFRTRGPNVKALKRQIQKRKAKALHLPKAPQSFDDVANIPDEFTVSIKLRAQKIAPTMHCKIRHFFYNLCAFWLKFLFSNLPRLEKISTYLNT